MFQRPRLADSLSSRSLLGYLSDLGPMKSILVDPGSIIDDVIAVVVIVVHS
jgi:hypothetical protein